MTKSYSILFASLFLLVLSSCQTLEQISIDYMRPGELSFPSQLRKVAIVNNMSTSPDSELTPKSEQLDEKKNEVARATAYPNANISSTTETLAEEIANQNYFDAVVICDSALRAKDLFPRESTLSQEEVLQLTTDLNVDFLIALENLQLKATKVIRHVPEFGGFQSTLDVKVYPTIKVYLPNRSTPMATLHPNDSIFWEEYGATETEALVRLISDKRMIKEASEFAGTIPVKLLLPLWTKEERYLYTGGNVNMRDAAIYVRENSWDKAYELWNQVFNATKSDKKKMQTALNIALYYELKDSLSQAEKWAIKAQQFAKKIDKVGEKNQASPGTRLDIKRIPNYYHTTLYVSELKERNSQLSKLKVQMSRFNDDF